MANNRFTAFFVIKEMKVGYRIVYCHRKWYDIVCIKK